MNPTGNRRYRATIKQHNGNTDSHNQPTYGTDDDWTDFTTDWPVELLTVSGGEFIRGRQVVAETTHVLFGEYHGAGTIDTTMRATVDGVTYDIVAAFDSTGTRRELRVEMKETN